MSRELQQAFGLGPIDQVAYVVEDLDQALPHFQALFGPFELMDYTHEGLEYRGELVTCRLRIGFNDSGPVQIEVIEVAEGETAHTEHLRKHGEGLHHVRFRVDDVDAKRAELEKAGFETLMYQRFAPGLAFAYMETPTEYGAGVIELFENRT